MQLADDAPTDCQTILDVRPILSSVHIVDPEGIEPVQLKEEALVTVTVVLTLLEQLVL